MDRELKAEIKATVRGAVREAMELYEERWLTAKQLSQYIGVCTERWLKDHGKFLPRSPIGYNDETGFHETSAMYPLHKIQRMIEDGSIKRLTL